MQKPVFLSFAEVDKDKGFVENEAKHQYRKY